MAPGGELPLKPPDHRLNTGDSLPLPTSKDNTYLHRMLLELAIKITYARENDIPYLIGCRGLFIFGFLLEVHHVV